MKGVKAAREKAITMAAELGQTVGKPWEVTEAADYDAEAYLAANTRQYLEALENRQESSPIAGGEVTIRAAVRVSFQLE